MSFSFWDDLFFCQIAFWLMLGWWSRNHSWRNILLKSDSFSSMSLVLAHCRCNSQGLGVGWTGTAHLNWHNGLFFPWSKTGIHRILSNYNARFLLCSVVCSHEPQIFFLEHERDHLMHDVWDYVPILTLTGENLLFAGLNPRCQFFIVFFVWRLCLFFNLLVDIYDFTAHWFFLGF